MKPFKLKIEPRWFERLTGFRLVIFLSSYRHGYKRGEPVNDIPIDAEQVDIKFVYPESGE